MTDEVRKLLDEADRAARTPPYLPLVGQLTAVIRRLAAALRAEARTWNEPHVAIGGRPMGGLDTPCAAGCGQKTCCYLVLYIGQGCGTDVRIGYALCGDCMDLASQIGPITTVEGLWAVVEILRNPAERERLRLEMAAAGRER